ncbi:unnamed protein product [Lasius platythorax]|uniref:Uncharacterized protein n=2 Tax=Lasius TaxID=488720 RepID=A0A0J7KGS2_LASNI|nr:hypothetical protein RF55_10745 [Lasius niger]
MEADRMLKEILTRMEEQERERKKNKEEIMKEMQELREEYRKKEMLWDQQKAKMENRIKRLEEKDEESKVNGREKQESGALQEKMKEVERSLELAERRRRKNNIILKGASLVNKGKRKNEIEKLLGEIAKRKVEVEEIKEIGHGEYQKILVKINS